MFLKILIVILFFLHSNCFSQSGWTQQSSGINSTLNSIHFENSLIGWCVGDAGKIIKTINGGTSWFLLNSETAKDLKSLSVTSLNNAFVVGDSGINIKTTDGGNSWISLNIPNQNYDFTSVFFLNDSLGFAVGILKYFEEPNMIYKTSNGGNTWDSLLTDPSMEVFVKTIFFINSNIGWIIKGFGALGTESIYKTTDGGVTWFYQFNITSLYTVFFIDLRTGWTSGEGSTFSVFKSTNGGNNWIPCMFCGVVGSNALYFIDSLKGWGASSGVVNHTSNGGANWTVQNTNHPLVKYNSIYFIDSLTGWTAGDSGVILKTTTGGVLTNFSNTSTEFPGNCFLSQNYPNPFNPITNLKFEIPDLGFVSLKVYDVLGNLVSTLVNEKKEPGTYEVEFDGSNLSSGIYFYRLEAGKFVQTNRMVLIK